MDPDALYSSERRKGQVSKSSNKIGPKGYAQVDRRYIGLMSATVRGLIPGNSYQFQVAALNNKEWANLVLSVSSCSQLRSLPPKSMEAVYISDVTPFGCCISWKRWTIGVCNTSMQFYTQELLIRRHLPNKSATKSWLKLSAKHDESGSETAPQKSSETPEDEEEDDSMIDTSKLEKIGPLEEATGRQSTLRRQCQSWG